MCEHITRKDILETLKELACYDNPCISDNGDILIFVDSSSAFCKEFKLGKHNDRVFPIASFAFINEKGNRDTSKCSDDDAYLVEYNIKTQPIISKLVFIDSLVQNDKRVSAFGTRDTDFSTTYGSRCVIPLQNITTYKMKIDLLARIVKLLNMQTSEIKYRNRLMKCAYETFA